VYSLITPGMPAGGRSKVVGGPICRLISWKEWSHTHTAKPAFSAPCMMTANAIGRIPRATLPSDTAPITPFLPSPCRLHLLDTFSIHHLYIHPLCFVCCYMHGYFIIIAYSSCILLCSPYFTWYHCPAVFLWCCPHCLTRGSLLLYELTELYYVFARLK
jgi:hypothetical protein